MEQNKKDLYIIGAGGLGRELELWISLIPEKNRDIAVMGFIDDNPAALDGYKSDFRILGSIEEYPFQSTDFVVISIAEPALKEKVYSKLSGKVRFYTFIATSAIVGNRDTIGEGTIICPNSIVSSNVTLGRCVTINCGSQIGHDSVIGDYSSFMANVMIGGESVIAEKAYFGSQSTLVPRKKVCSNVKVSAGSVVISTLRKSGVYFGNPAKLLFE